MTGLDPETTARWFWILFHLFGCVVLVLFIGAVAYGITKTFLDKAAEIAAETRYRYQVKKRERELEASRKNENQ